MTLDLVQIPRRRRSDIPAGIYVRTAFIRSAADLIRDTFAVCVVLSVFAGCSGDSPAGPGDAAAAAAVLITPDSLSLEYGTDAEMRAVVLDSMGDTLSVEVQWSVTDSMIAAIGGPRGERHVSALNVGTTTIRAALGELSDTATVRVEPIRFVAVDAGGHNYRGHSCGISTTGRAFCWGTNYEGQLGIGTRDELLQRGMNHPVAVDGPSNFTTVVSGGEHACALTERHEVFCWGANAMGQLGDGTELRKTIPVRVETDVEFETIAAGYNHTCGLDRSGASYCWGLDEYGQLGGLAGHRCAGRYLCSRVPSVVVGGLTLKAISAGAAHTCGLTIEGDAYCWGYNIDGRLGDSTATASGRPVPVAGDHEFVAIGASNFHTCAVASDGAAYCWGGNHVGQLGNSTTSPSTVPVPVDGGIVFDSLTVSEVAIHTCGVTPSGTVYCWGVGTCGQLGYNEPRASCETQGATGGFIAWPAPVPASASGMSTVTAGNEHTCGMAADGVAWCWGRGSAGQLGNGSYESSAAPVLVSGQTPREP